MTEIKDLKVGDRIRVVGGSDTKINGPEVGTEGVIIRAGEDTPTTAEFSGFTGGHPGYLEDDAKNRWYLWSNSIQVERIEDKPDASDVDEEAVAITNIIQSLKKLDTFSQGRVISYVTARFCV
jgi:hypothetical protein